MIRDRIRNKARLTITHFVHIPWPGPEYWGILPPTMRQEILEGLCGADLVGFQTKEDGLNFIRTVESYLPNARVGYSSGRVSYRRHTTHIRDFPISIDVESLKQLAASDEVADLRIEVERIIQDCRLILRIDRIEPSKNIVRGFQSFEELLELYPDYHDQVQFLVGGSMPSLATAPGNRFASLSGRIIHAQSPRCKCMMCSWSTRSPME
jgi:trehalose 6-phosphate synthase